MAKKANQSVELPIIMSSPKLWALRFSRTEAHDEAHDEPEAQKSPLSFNLGFARPARDQLGVEFTVELSHEGAADILVTYRADFKLEPEEGQDVDYDAAFRQIGGSVAPAAIYPFMREVVASAASRAGLPPILLPVINFRHFFKPEDISVPSFVEAEDNALEPEDALSAIG